MDANENLLDKKIGDKELPKLEAKPVQVQGVKVEPKFKKTDPDKEVGKIVVLICKHPDKEELMEFTQMKILKNDKEKVVGLWYHLDEDGNLQKGSRFLLYDRFFGGMQFYCHYHP